jgi:hypothetical protein
MKQALKPSIKYISLYILIFMVIFIPKTIDIAHSMTTDETPWLMRSANFYKAVVTNNFIETKQDMNIGVFTMWINSISYYINEPNIANHAELYTKDYSKIGRIIKESGGDPLSTLAFSRIIMVFSLSIAITLIAFFLAKIIGTIPAVFSSIMLGYGIFYSGLMRTAHLDAPMATFMLLSTIIFLTYRYFDNRKIFLVLSGIIGGAAVLAKLFGIMTIAVIGLIGIISLFYQYEISPQRSITKLIIKLITDLSIWVISLLLIIFIFWPSMWVNPFQTLLSVINSVNPYTNATLQGLNENGQSGSGINNFSWYMRYFVIYLWYTSPIFVAGLPLAISTFFGKIGLFANLKIRYVGFSLFLSAAGLYSSISIITKSSYDYILPVQLVLNLLSCFGLYSLAIWVGILFLKKRNKGLLIQQCIIIFILLSQIIYNLSYAPVYLSYLSPIMGGPQKIEESRTTGMGEGLDEAGRYLNQKPGAENLTVTSWYGIGPFSFYFIGVTKMLPVWPTMTDAMIENIISSDYLVTYINQWYRHYPEQLFLILNSIDPEHEIWVDGIHYANIYPVTENIKNQLKDYIQQ